MSKIVHDDKLNPIQKHFSKMMKTIAEQAAIQVYNGCVTAMMDGQKKFRHDLTGDECLGLLSTMTAYFLCNTIALMKDINDKDDSEHSVKEMFEGIVFGASHIMDIEIPKLEERNVKPLGLMSIKNITKEKI